MIIPQSIPRVQRNTQDSAVELIERTMVSLFVQKFPGSKDGNEENSSVLSSGKAANGKCRTRRRLSDLVEFERQRTLWKVCYDFCGKYIRLQEPQVILVLR
jgi:hypothetical protein